MAARSARARASHPYEFSVTMRVRHPGIDPANLRLEPSLLRQVADLGLRLEFEFD